MSLVSLGELSTMVAIFGNNDSVQFNGVFSFIRNTASRRERLDLGLDQWRQLEEHFLGQPGGSSLFQIAIRNTVVSTTNGTLCATSATRARTSRTIVGRTPVASGGRSILILGKLGFNVVYLGLNGFERGAGSWLLAGTLSASVFQSHVS